jgi:hypothetical protein
MNAEPIDRSTRKRPFGISVIIFMMILYSALLALIFIASLGANYGDDAIQSLDMKGAPIGILLLQYNFFPVFIIFELVIIFGLWRLERWAWMLLMIQVGLSILIDIWGYFHAQPTYLTMLLNVIVVFYLNQQDVQRVFVSKSEVVTDGRIKTFTEI